MLLSLGPRSSRFLLAALASAAMLYACLCVRSFRADKLAESGSLKTTLRATTLEPANAAYWRQLGDVRLYGENDPHAALFAFQRATDLNPRDADAWIGAANALQVLDRSNEEHETVLRALAAEPRRPEVIWQAANLFAVMGDRDSMQAEVCVLLAHDRVRAQDASELGQRAIPNFSCEVQGAVH